MSSAIGEVQRAVYDKLTSDVQLIGQITGLFDHVPQNQAFPYAMLEFGTSSGWDTFGQVGQQITFNVHAWSRERGKKQAQAILSRVDTVLHRGTLGALSGFTTVDLLRDDGAFEEYFVEQDGLTYHGVMRFRVWIQPA